MRQPGSPQRRARAVPDVPDTGSLPGDMRAFLRALIRSRSAAQQALAGVSSEIATRAAARGELAPDADIDLLSQLPLSLLQNWRLEHGRQPGDEVADRIVRQFYTPGPQTSPSTRSLPARPRESLRWGDSRSPCPRPGWQPEAPATAKCPW